MYIQEKREEGEEEEEEEEEEDEGEEVDLWAIALYAYSATEDDELTFEKGARIHLTVRSSWDDDTGQGWYQVRCGVV